MTLLLRRQNYMGLFAVMLTVQDRKHRQVGERELLGQRPLSEDWIEIGSELYAAS
jgi:hypothetical protein